MIGITERAKQQLKKTLSDNVDMPQAGLRLVYRSEGQLGLGIDVENPGDEVVEFEGSKVLMVEKNLADSLTGVTLDVEDTEEGAKLVLIDSRPQ
jgi:Fe-S cluster assembly iron-binding protein IscA